jgi:flagellar export protein FliJ
MAFEFSLASVLRFREMIEEREEVTLQKLLAEISQLSDAIERIDAQLAQTYASRLVDIFKPTIGLDLQASYGEVKNLKQRRQELEVQIQKLEQAQATQLNVYMAARRNREILSDMREKTRNEYRSNVIKREQKGLDDDFAARQSRS